MRNHLLALLASLSTGVAVGITVSGSLSGQVTPVTRVSLWSVTSFGQPADELVSSGLNGRTFSFSLPERPVTGKAVAAVTPQNVSWPGVIDPVTVKGSAQAAELRFFVYGDQNGNARRDANEPLREVDVSVNGASLFIVWVSADVTVTASKGYTVSLKPGMNAVLVDVGRDVKVMPYRPEQNVQVQLGH